MPSLVSLPKAVVKELCNSKIEELNAEINDSFLIHCLYIFGLGRVSREMQLARKLLKACELTKHHIWISVEDLDKICD